jgi:hypothetical protein
MRTMRGFAVACMLLAGSSVAQEKTGTTTGGSLTVENCKSGPDTCQKGFVWREASPKDHVCVKPAMRKQAHDDNAKAASRRDPKAGAYGPDTCLKPYVWREAFAGDHVCVAEPARSQAAEDNKMAASRKACHKK